MRFLVTNDDGIEAPGLAALASALADLGEVIVLAPHEHKSGCSHHATTDRPLLVAKVRDGWHSIDGSPVDCTRVGLTELAAGADWVISGINEGGNLGADVYLSGTVAAAREACIMGKPAIALSQYIRRGPPDWYLAARRARHVIADLIARPAVLGRFWNVNFPHGEAGKIIPECVECPLDPHPLPIRYEAIDGKLMCRVDYHNRRRETSHDVDVCFDGRIAITLLALT